MIKQYLILGVAVTAVAGTAFWVSKTGDSSPGANLSEVVAELTEEGFVPKNLNVLKGQKVTFKTTRGKEFWPASDLHPTHGIYPEFDPQRPIPPDQSWTFQFNKIGEWRYHDHLYPHYRGTIKVVQNP